MDLWLLLILAGGAACIATAGVFVVVLLWLGPETRGRSLD